MLELRNFFPSGANLYLPGFENSRLLLLGILILFFRWSLLAFSLFRGLHQSPKYWIAYIPLILVADYL